MTGFAESGARAHGRRARAAAGAALVVAAGLAGGCDSVAMTDPRTGAVEICQDGARGLTPWSQTEACVADREAQGWTRVAADR